jgi:hypothetical protein
MRMGKGALECGQTRCGDVNYVTKTKRGLAIRRTVQLNPYIVSFARGGFAPDDAKEFPGMITSPTVDHILD